VRSRHHGLVTVLFAEFDAFGRVAPTTEPARFAETIERYFGVFDDIAERFGLERVKTLGDSYVCAGGLSAGSTSVSDACHAAVAMQAAVERINRERAGTGLDPWALTIGIHAGPAMTGVVGQRKTTYDIWGDVVTVARRVASAGVPGAVAVSATVYERVRDVFSAQPREPMKARGGDRLPVYVLHACSAPAPNADSAPSEP